MTNEEKWKAVIKNNADSDGEFFYAVKTTRIFCRPSCKSKSPLKTNVVFFDNKLQAMDAGYRPCKRCRPDLLEFCPTEELTRKAKDVIDTHFADNEKLTKHIKNLGVNKSYLNKLFLQSYGKTMAEYLRFVRISKAKEMLLEGAAIVDSVFECGFGSVSTFYSNFKKETGYSPKNFLVITKNNL